MFKGKSLLALILTTSLLLTVTIAIVGVTIAWYNTKNAENTQLEMNANGVMVIYLDGEPIFTDTKLKPAIAVKDKITENTTEFNVLTTNENIAQAATSVTVTTTFTYLNSSGSDPDTYGIIPADVTLNTECKVIFSDETEKTIRLSEELNVSINASVHYLNDADEDYVTTVIANTPFEIAGDAQISFTITMYFKKVDDLIDPDILRADELIVSLNILVEPIEE
ncbi:MAG: hypothetical protein K5765_04450 [Clostridia bacterium]|nr:hypothetical protein [Clostridia bacterium]